MVFYSFHLCAHGRPFATEPGFESDGNAFFFYTTGTSFSLFFPCKLQLLTAICHESTSVIKLIRRFMDDTSVRYARQLHGQLAVSTQNCFSTLYYTPYTNIKTSAQNAPKCTIARQKIKKFSGEGLLPRPPPSRRLDYRVSRLWRLALPFLFTYNLNTGVPGGEKTLRISITVSTAYRYVRIAKWRVK